MNDGRKLNRPPEEHRFQKGKSGNPTGRPKKRPREYSEAQQVRDVLDIGDMTVNIDFGKGKQQVPLGKAVVYRAFIKAANGDNAMLKLAIELMQKALMSNRDANPTIFRAIDNIVRELDEIPVFKHNKELLDKLDWLRNLSRPA